MTTGHAPIEWMVDGYAAALTRLLAETSRGDAGEKQTFLPLFEALNWAASIDSAYFEARDPIGDELLTGVRLVRNRVHHQWELALARYDAPGVVFVQLASTSSRIVGPPPGFWWHWVDTALLPPGRKFGETEYNSRLARQRLDRTLTAILPTLEALI